MKIKYNEFGEVVSVNGLTTGHHIGTPMQDALGTPETNCCYAEEMGTVTSCGNTCDDAQPTPAGGGGGGVSSWNDLTDKPFYGEEGEVIVPDTWMTTGGGGIFTPADIELPWTPPRELILGEEFIVNCGGDVYHCTLVDPYVIAPDEAEARGFPKGLYFINSNPQTDPFQILYVSSDITVEGIPEAEELAQFKNTILSITASSATVDEYPMSIRTPGTLKTLDEKYIPKTIARQSDLEALIARIEALEG